MLGYYKNQSATSDTFENDWFKTGDLGYFDEDGFLFICGRKKSVIIANNGENVFPEEIEDILNRNQFILECMVYGEENDKHDERIAALIVPDTGAFIEYSSKNNVQINPEIIDQLISQAVKQTNSQLVPFKQIKKYYIQEKELEKTTTQKVKRHLAGLKVVAQKSIQEAPPIQLYSRGEAATLIEADYRSCQEWYYQVCIPAMKTIANKRGLDFDGYLAA